MHILHVVGARPNFMKAASVIRSLGERRHIKQTLVHTGQHYDLRMSDVFFAELGIPEPDVNLQVGSASHAQQSAEIMRRFEPVVVERKPDLVLVYGDVNSTVSAALVCSKLQIKVGHVEAGLRSFDRSLPEEVNRVLTDQVADLLFTPSAEADANLMREGIPVSKIHRVGNVMIDTLVRMLGRARETERNGRYALVTLHRPGNVDDLPWLGEMIAALQEISHDLKVIFPVHPRTRQRMNDCGLLKGVNGSFQLVEPLPYLDFLTLQRHACFVITDSGGIQEETTFLNIPCLTVRENTERPVTVEVGSNILVGRSVERLRGEVRRILAGQRKMGRVPELWDGSAADRIAAVIEAWPNRVLEATKRGPTAVHS